MEEASASGQFTAQLPLLVVGSADLLPMAEALATTLGANTQLLCKDVGECTPRLF